MKTDNKLHRHWGVRWCVYLSIIAGMLPGKAHAQDTHTLPAAPGPITIDGNLKEWGDSLLYAPTDKKFTYTIARNQDHIYLAVSFYDRTDQMRIMRAGLTWGFNPKGKKKNVYAITFPMHEPGSEPVKPAEAPAEKEPGAEGNGPFNPENIAKTRLGMISVTGFTDVENDLITNNNTYGFKAAIGYNDKGDLTYEAAIPIRMLNLPTGKNDKWAFNIRINGIEKPSGDKEGMAGGPGGGGGHGRGGGGMGGGGGMSGRGGGMGGGGMGGGRGGMRQGGGGADFSALSKATDCWQVFLLPPAR